MRRRGGDVPARILAGAVHVYRWTLRPMIGANCRFEPSCSHYALAVLSTHGAARGSLLAARRVLRCNPWHPGGYDPPPPAPSEDRPDRADNSRDPGRPADGRDTIFAASAP